MAVEENADIKTTDHSLSKGLNFIQLWSFTWWELTELAPVSLQRRGKLLWAFSRENNQAAQLLLAYRGCPFYQNTTVGVSW